MANRQKKLKACQLSVQYLESKVNSYYQKRKEKRRRQDQVMPYQALTSWKTHELVIIKALIPQLGERAEKFFQDQQAPLVYIWDFKDKWIRPLRDWRPAKNRKGFKLFKDLVNHLFVAYNLPAFMYKVWEHPDRYPMNWFWVLANGYTIKHADVPLPLTKKMAHWYQFAPGNLTPLEALHWARVMGMSQSKALAKTYVATVVQNQLQGDHPFWDKVIHFFANHPNVSIRQIAALMRYLYYRRFVNGENLILKGRSIKVLIRLKDEWEVEQRLAKLRQLEKLRQWQPSNIKGMNWVFGKKRKVHVYYFIHELTNEKALKEEGKMMRHCVAGYVRRCMDTSYVTSIWSLKRSLPHSSETQRVLTIQVTNNRIVQVKGKCNRQPSADEIDLLSQWAKRERLRLEVGC